MPTCPVCSNEVLPSDAACPSCGFRLAGSTQSFKPISFIEPEAEKPQGKVNGTLRVLRGPQIDTIYSLGDGTKEIGRNPQCDIFLNDMTVSRLHALVSKVDDKYLIKDHNSFNGLWINDSLIAEAELKQGDVVQIGVFCLKFEMN